MPIFGKIMMKINLFGKNETFHKKIKIFGGKKINFVGKKSYFSVKIKLVG